MAVRFEHTAPAWAEDANISALSWFEMANFVTFSSGLDRRCQILESVRVSKLSIFVTICSSGTECAKSRKVSGLEIVHFLTPLARPGRRVLISGAFWKEAARS